MTLENSNINKAVSALVLAAALGAGAAHAADLPSRKDAPVYAPPPPVFSWTGFYGGLNVGGGFSAANATFGRASGVIGGGQIGYNYQLSPLFVVGVENDFQGTSLSTRNNGSANPNVSLPWFGTGRGRAGLALLDSRLLVYGTGGLALGQVNDVLARKTRMGWTAGGGAEWAFLPNWSAKLEYLYTDLYKSIKNDGMPDRHAKFHTIRIGVNYHFNLF